MGVRRAVRALSALGEDRYLKYILVLPCLLLILFVTLFPTIYAYYLSLHRVTVETFYRPVFVGLENFRKAITNREMWYTLFFTALYMVTVTSCEALLGLGLALLFNRELKGSKILISLILAPMAVAPALFGIMIKLMLNPYSGIIPYILGRLGIRFSPLVNFSSAFLTLVVIDVIEWTPFVFIILYSALRALPSQPFEAALIDGASSWQMFKNITVPLLKPAILVALAFRLMDAFKSFDTIYVLTGGGPGIVTSTISIFIYKQAFLLGDFGYSSAVTIFLFYLSIALATLSTKLLYRPR